MHRAKAQYSYAMSNQKLLNYLTQNRTSSNRSATP